MKSSLSTPFIALLMTFSFIGSLASADVSETPISSLSKSGPNISVINETNRFSVGEALALALQHGGEERLRIDQNCVGTFGNATTKLEKCQVTVAKLLPASRNGSCGEYSKGDHIFRFTRALRFNSIYEIRGDVELQISRR